MLPFCNIKLYGNSSISWAEYDKITKKYKLKLLAKW